MAYDPKKFDWWRDALAGKDPPIHADQPMQGFYAYRKDKTERPVPVALWYGGDGELKCKVGENNVRYGVDIWPNIARFPIAEEVYRSVKGGADWPNELRFTDDGGRTHSTQERAPTLATAAQGDEKSAVLDDLQTWVAKGKDAKKAGVPATKDEADKAADVAKKIFDLAKDADAERKSKTQPLFEQQKLIKAGYDKFISPAESLARDIKSLINAYIDRERKKREEEAEKLRAMAKDTGVEVTVAAPPVRAGTGGRSMHQVTVSVVVLDDVKAAARYFAERNDPPKDFIEALERNAYRILMAGGEVPGAKLEKRKETR